MANSTQPKKLFYSYSHDDEDLRIKLEKHLISLKRNGLISSWVDRDIMASEDFGEKINENLVSADIILLLISSSFMSSDYINDIELKIALDRHAKKEVRVIPVILRECFWKIEPFAKLQALPKDAVPVTSSAWKSIDEAFTDVAKGIYRVVTTI